MFGGTIQQTRHTVTAQGQENGMTNSELDGQLGHSAEGSLKHYLNLHQIPKDVNHIHILQEFGILNILSCLMDKTEMMTELVNSEDRSFRYWGGEIFAVNNPTLLAIRTINSGELSFWSVEDEKRYQTLLSKESKGKWKFKNGVNTKVEVTSEMFSTELKELIEKKEAIITDLDNKQQKEAMRVKLWITPDHDEYELFQSMDAKNLAEIEVKFQVLEGQGKWKLKEEKKTDETAEASR